VSVVVVGLNHRTVPLDILERMSVPAGSLSKALDSVAGRDHVTEVVVLSTCHRTEVYAFAERYHGAVQDIRNFFGEHAFMPPEDFSDRLYTYHDESAIAHLFAVACGLDSVVLGESEILSQVKNAWERAREEGHAGPSLSALFRHALEVGKRARSETGIGRHVTSLSQAAVSMASERLGGLDGARILLLGAGDMGESMAVALAGAGASEVLVANRTWDRAVALAARVGGRAVELGGMLEALREVDVLLTSTGAPAVVVDRTELTPVIETRNGRPLLVVDIAMPRDIDPSVGELPGVTLLDLDDLRSFAEVGRDRRRKEVTRVRAIVADEVARFLDRESARAVAPAISALRERAELLRSDELARFRGRLDGLDARQRETVEALTKGLVNKLLHEPTVRLKEAAGSTRGERLAAALRDLFGL
jgi:glutamyl-tRNA reductase